MKYNITLQVKSLGDAAAIEALANELTIPFQLNTVTGVTEPPPKKTTRRHMKVTPAILAQVKNLIKMHPNASDTKILELADLPHSTSTINRIRNNHYDSKGNVRKRK